MFRRVSAGMKQQISASAFNACLDAAEAFQQGRLTRPGQSTPAIPNDTVLVKNNSGSAQNRFAVLGLDVPLILPSDDATQFANEVMMSAVAPTASHVGKFCVLQEPLAAGAMGRALVAGITPVSLNVAASGDAFAELSSGVTATLATGPTGSAQILWKESGTGTKWGTVLLRGSAAVPDSISKIVNQAAHGFTVGQVLKRSSGAYALAKADTTANAQAVGIVTAVIDTGSFVLMMAGFTGAFSGLTDGARYYLSAATAGALTTTAPAIPVVIYDAVSATSAIVNVGGGGGGGAAPTEDGTVWCSKSDLSGGEWVNDVDIGQNVTAKAGVLRIKSPNASGDAVVIDGALVTAAGKKLTVREIDVCDSGVAKKMLVVASATY